MYSTTLIVDELAPTDFDAKPWREAAMRVLPQRAGPNDMIFEFQPKDVHNVFAQSVAARSLPNDSFWYQFVQSKASYILWTRKKSEEEVIAQASPAPHGDPRAASHHALQGEHQRAEE